MNDDQYRKSLQQLFTFVDRTIKPTLEGERKANARFEREIAEEERQRIRAAAAKGRPS